MSVCKKGGIWICQNVFLRMCSYHAGVFVLQNVIEAQSYDTYKRNETSKLLERRDKSKHSTPSGKNSTSLPQVELNNRMCSSFGNQRIQNVCAFM